MSVRNWIMVVLCTVQLSNQPLSLIVFRKRATFCTCIGAFRASPHMEASELLLQLRHQQLCLQYISELRSNLCNPAFSSVFGTGFRRLFEARPIPSPHLVSEGIKTYLTRKSTSIVLQQTRLLTSLHSC